MGLTFTFLHVLGDRRVVQEIGRNILSSILRDLFHQLLATYSVSTVRQPANSRVFRGKYQLAVRYVLCLVATSVCFVYIYRNELCSFEVKLFVICE